MLYENTEAGFDIGVSRGGHSGGYWYVATLTEGDGQTTVSGEIVFRSYHSNGELREETKREKILGWIAFVLIFLLILPAALVALAIWGIMELIGKLRGRPTEFSFSKSLSSFLLFLKLTCAKHSATISPSVDSIS